MTNTIPVGTGPFKAAQSNNGRYIYVLNSGDETISIIDGLTETVVETVHLSAGPVLGLLCAADRHCDGPELQ